MANDKFPRFSDLDFVPTDAFPIEDSPSRDRLIENNMSVDFIRKLGNELLFVEAKSTFPNPNSAGTPGRFDEEISEICNKFAVSLKLFSAIKVGVTSDILPDALSEASKVQVTFALVISKFDNEKWCVPIKKALEQTLPTETLKLWMPKVKVYTQNTAREYALI